MSRADLEAAQAALEAYVADTTGPTRIRDWAGGVAARLDNILNPIPEESFMPRLGDQVERYLLVWRNRASDGSVAQRAIDTVIEDYRRRATLGVALDTTIPPAGP